jgi:hypothetical protein
MVAFKVIVVPALIGVVSLAGRRWGSAVSGWLAGFPWTSGPIALLLTLEHGPAFGAQAAHGIMLGLVSAAAFCWSYSRFARSSGWVSSLLRGWAVFGLVTLALARLRIGSTAGFAMVLVVLSAALAAWPAGRPVEARPNFPAWDIPSRMFAALALVLAITGLAQVLGPSLTGLLTPFPVYSSVLAAFTHRVDDAASANTLLRGVVIGSFTFSTFFVVVATRLEAWGAATTFAMALAIALVVHGVSFRLVRPARAVARPAPGA